MVLLVKICYEIFSGKATLGTTGFDIDILITMNVVMFISLYRSKTIYTPKILLGRTLTIELIKKERFLKSYMPEFFVAMAGLSVGSYFSRGYHRLLPIIITHERFRYSIVLSYMDSVRVLADGQ